MSTKLASIPACVVGGTHYVRQLGRLAAPGDANWLTWGDDLTHLADAQWIDDKVPLHRIRLRSSSINAQIEAARSGVGLLIAARAFAQLPGLAALQLHPKLQREVDQIPQASLWLVGHRALRQVPRIAVVWNWIRELIAQETAQA